MQVYAINVRILSSQYELAIVSNSMGALDEAFSTLNAKCSEMGSSSINSKKMKVTTVCPTNQTRDAYLQMKMKLYDYGGNTVSISAKILHIRAFVLGVPDYEDDQNVTGLEPSPLTSLIFCKTWVPLYVQ